MHTGQVMEPLVLQEGDYRASLDGITLGGELILEVKCPFKGRASELWKDVAAREVPAQYWWQIRTQLMVAGAALAHLYVFDGTVGVRMDVRPEPETWPRITNAWDEFQRYLDSDTLPPLTEKDVRLRDDHEWIDAVAAYIAAKQLAEERAVALDATKAALIGLASHSSKTGGGVKVPSFRKAVAVDYKKIPAPKGVDLDQNRGKAREEFRITVG